MKKIVKTAAVALALIILASAGIFTGCSNVQKIMISGDPEVADIVSKLAYIYTSEVRKDVVIDVNATGAALGFQDVVNGISDIGLMARELQGEEGRYVKSTVSFIASEGIVLIVNNDFRVDYVQKLFGIDEIADLFFRDTDTWERAMWPTYDNVSPDIPMEYRYRTPDAVMNYFKKLPLVPINRPQSSGLREAFDQPNGGVNLRFRTMFSGDGPAKTWPNYEGKNTLTAQSEAEALSYVINTPGAVAFVRYSTYLSNKDQVQALPINFGGRQACTLVYPTYQNMVTGKYPLMRKFRFFINANGVNEATREFLEWLTTDEEWVPLVCARDNLVEAPRGVIQDW